jgi:hypothetical protein
MRAAQPFVPGSAAARGIVPSLPERTALIEKLPLDVFLI